MRRLAIFVEGQTELLFVEELVKAIIGERHLTIQTIHALGGNTVPRRTVFNNPVVCPNATKYYVLIRDCGTDDAVISDIRQYCDQLATQGYEAIIGIRDVPPKTERRAIPDLLSSKYFYRGLRNQKIPVLLVLSVMELESYFLAEYTHFERLNANLTVDRIASVMGYDLRTKNTEDLDRPSHELAKIYALEGLVYNKKYVYTKATISSLDFALMYLDVPNRVPSLRPLIEKIEDFMS